jgi:hypothetical protein
MVLSTDHPFLFWGKASRLRSNTIKKHTRFNISTENAHGIVVDRNRKIPKYILANFNRLSLGCNQNLSRAVKPVERVIPSGVPYKFLIHNNLLFCNNRYAFFIVPLQPLFTQSLRHLARDAIEWNVVGLSAPPLVQRQRPGNHPRFFPNFPIFPDLAKLGLDTDRKLCYNFVAVVYFCVHFHFSSCEVKCETVRRDPRAGLFLYSTHQHKRSGNNFPYSVGLDP